MSKSVSAPVAPKSAAATTAQVRAFGIEKGMAKEGRGRFSTSLIEAFNEAHPEAQYAVGTASAAKSAMVALPVVKKNARGARIKQKVSVPASEVRRLAGAKPTGRLSSEAKAKAARAYEVETFGSEQG